MVLVASRSRWVRIRPGLHDLERPDRLLATLAHEMHHVARLRSGVETYTLGGRFVSEGLAQCFEEEVGAPTPFYAMALDDEALKRMADRARPLLSATDYEHDNWMFGRRAIPSAAPCGIFPGVRAGECVARQEGFVSHRRRRCPGFRDHGRLAIGPVVCLRRSPTRALLEAAGPRPSSRSRPTGRCACRSNRRARRPRRSCRRLACRSLARGVGRRAIHPT